MGNIIELRSISKLIKEKFVIPSYQRGYRWDKDQVNALLQDIYEFTKRPVKKENEDFYCLQPVVVKNIDGVYSIIDGQQRLTTIYIILKYLQKNTFSISYETRKGSKQFLENIQDLYDKEGEGTENNPDYFFMKKAYKTIKEWFETTAKENEESYLEDDMSLNIQRSCDVIWYEVNDASDVESIFTRLNIGKIPLTNSELIKALFLKDTNFEEGKIRQLRQLEMSKEWDNIENTLQDNKIWFFINPIYNKIPATRIDYIFDSISQKTRRNDNYFTFRYFANKIKETDVLDIWSTIKGYFNTILEWYNDSELYHLIGYLTAIYKEADNKIEVSDLISEYNEGEYTKTEFKNYINSIIASEIKGVVLEELDYDNDYDLIKKILLLFNVITVKNKTSAYSRFPFDSYHMNEWSLEHIHARNADGMQRFKELWISWIDEHINSFKDFEDAKYKKIVNKLEKVDKSTLTYDDFSLLFDEISMDISDDYGIDLNNMNNLALLDCKDNASIGNNFFDVKRRMIIKKDINSEFIPVCTRNVFLKYYSNDASQIHYWSEKDREDYLNAIKNMLKDYLEEGDEQDEQ